MVKSERNRQIMCEGGLVSTLLAHCRSMLLSPNHPLHLPVTRILEKLSSQAISHSDFRSAMLSVCFFNDSEKYYAFDMDFLLLVTQKVHVFKGSSLVLGE